MEEALISEVKKRNVLWNKQNPKHKDRLVFEIEWQSVAKNIGISKQSAKMKWRNIRDQFVKELKKIPTNNLNNLQGYGSEFPGKWQYFTSLLFLRNSENIVATRQQTETSDEEFRQNEYTSTDMSEKHNDSIRSSLLLKEEILRPKRRIERSKSSSMERQILAGQEDENCLFFRSLIPFMRKLEPIQQLRVRIKFQQALMEEMEPSTSAINLRAHFSERRELQND